MDKIRLFNLTSQIIILLGTVTVLAQNANNAKEDIVDKKTKAQITQRIQLQEECIEKYSDTLNQVTKGFRSKLDSLKNVEDGIRHNLTRQKTSNLDLKDKTLQEKRSIIKDIRIEVEATPEIKIVKQERRELQQKIYRIIEDITDGDKKCFEFLKRGL